MNPCINKGIRERNNANVESMQIYMLLVCVGWGNHEVLVLKLHVLCVCNVCCLMDLLYVMPWNKEKYVVCAVHKDKGSRTWKVKSHFIGPNLVAFAIFTTNGAAAPLLILIGSCCDCRNTTLLVISTRTSTFTRNQSVVTGGFWLLTDNTKLLHNRSSPIFQFLVWKCGQIQSWESACNTITFVVTPVFAIMKQWIHGSLVIIINMITYLHKVRLPQGPGRQFTPSVVPQ